MQLTAAELKFLFGQIDTIGLEEGRERDFKEELQVKLWKELQKVREEENEV